MQATNTRCTLSGPPCGFHGAAQTTRRLRTRPLLQRARRPSIALASPQVRQNINELMNCALLVHAASVTCSVLSGECTGLLHATAC